jgi:hypothetical protein
MSILALLDAFWAELTVLLVGKGDAREPKVLAGQQEARSWRAAIAVVKNGPACNAT